MRYSDSEGDAEAEAKAEAQSSAYLAKLEAAVDHPDEFKRLIFELVDEYTIDDEEAWVQIALITGLLYLNRFKDIDFKTEIYLYVLTECLEAKNDDEDWLDVMGLIKDACKELLKLAYQYHIDGQHPALADNALLQVALHGYKDDKAEALTALKRRITIYPDNPLHFKTLGDYYQQLEKYDQARECYITASKLGDTTSLLLVYPELNAEACFELAKSDDNCAAVAYLLNRYEDEGKPAEIRDMLLSCFRHGYGATVNPEMIARITGAATSASASTPARLAASSTQSFWHNGSYPRILMAHLNFQAMLLGGFSDEVNFFGAPVRLQGEQGEVVQKYMLPSLQHFLDKKRDGISTIDAENMFAEAKDNSEYRRGDWNDAQKEGFSVRLNEGSVVAFASAWQNDKGGGHAIELSFKKIDDVVYLAISNRGDTSRFDSAGNPISGITLFRVDKPEALNNPIIMQKLQKKYVLQSYVENDDLDSDGIGHDFGLVHVAHFAKSPQKFGNCAMVTGYSQFLMQLVYHFASQPECKISEGGVDWDKAYEAANVIYKIWRFDSRVEAVEGLMQMGDRSNDISMPPEKHLAIVDCTIDYISHKSGLTLDQKQALLRPVVNYLNAECCQFSDDSKLNFQMKLRDLIVDDAAVVSAGTAAVIGVG